MFPISFTYIDSKDSGTASSEDGDNHHHHKSHHRLNESHPGSGSPSPDICDKPGGGYPLYHPAALHHYRPPVGSPIDIKHTPGSSTNANLNSKPRIWSLADMASKEEKESTQDSKHSSIGIHHHHHPHYGPPGHGKILSPLASRMPYPPYIKHELGKPDIYRNFNGSHGGGGGGGAPPHMAVGHPDYALLESYQRALVAHNGLAASMHPLSTMMAKSSDGTPAFAPLSLTTAAAAAAAAHNNNSTSVPSSGASPSASSTSSRPDNSTPLSILPPTSHDRQHASAMSTP